MTAQQEKKSDGTRPSIVVVMGHIDHGKTTLLDFIRKSKVAEREAGGITQAIGTYQIEHNGKKITFIDTPGHETFSAMRARGARVADIAILVVAADEGVKPQTEEALKSIQAAEIPFAVAINKIDRPNADPNRTRQQLAEKNVLVEGYGGTIPAVELSAKTGQGVDALLETILLLAELEELTDDPAKPAEGVVIESHLDPKRGASATLLVESGTLRRGEFIVIGGKVTPVRIFENFLGETIEEAHASDPIRIAGFPGAPGLGERFSAFEKKSEAEDAAAAPPKAEAHAETATPARVLVNIVLKADVLGSKEAIENALTAIGSGELGARLLKSEVGDVNESDVKTAAAKAGSFIAAFNVKIPGTIRELAERAGVPIIEKSIIYELLDEMKTMMMSLAPTELKRVELGEARLLARFKEEKGKQIVGGKVATGMIRKGARFEVVRNGRQVGTGRILGLQTQRKDAEEVGEGNEFGLLVEADLTLATQDMLKVFAEERVAPTF